MDIFLEGADRLARELHEQRNSGRVVMLELAERTKEFERECREIRSRGGVRHDWPFKTMDVGEEVWFDVSEAKKARLAAHAYAQANGFVKFKTRTIDGDLHVKRME